MATTKPLTNVAVAVAVCCAANEGTTNTMNSATSVWIEVLIVFTGSVDDLSRSRRGTNSAWCVRENCDKGFPSIESNRQKSQSQRHEHNSRSATVCLSTSRSNVTLQAA